MAVLQYPLRKLELGGLDGGIQGQQIGLIGDILDSADQTNLELGKKIGAEQACPLNCILWRYYTFTARCLHISQTHALTLNHAIFDRHRFFCGFFHFHFLMHILEQKVRQGRDQDERTDHVPEKHEG